MDGGPKQPVVDFGYPSHLRLGQGRHCGRFRERSDLCGPTGPGDDGGHGIMHQNPPQRAGNQVIGAEERFQFVRGTKSGSVVDAGEGLAFVEGFAVAVVRPVVVLPEGRLCGESSGQQAAGQRDARQNPDVVGLSRGKSASAGLGRNMLKITSMAAMGYSRACRPSETFSMLTP